MRSIPLSIMRFRAYSVVLHHWAQAKKLIQLGSALLPIPSFPELLLRPRDIPLQAVTVGVLGVRSACHGS
jgi:hypothetical protein